MKSSTINEYNLLENHFHLMALSCPPSSSMSFDAHLNCVNAIDPNRNENHFQPHLIAMIGTKKREETVRTERNGKHNMNEGTKEYRSSLTLASQKKRTENIKQMVTRCLRVKRNGFLSIFHFETNCFGVPSQSPLFTHLIANRMEQLHFDSLSFA